MDEFLSVYQCVARFIPIVVDKLSCWALVACYPFFGQMLGQSFRIPFDYDLCPQPTMTCLENTMNARITEEYKLFRFTLHGQYLRCKR